MPVVVLPGRGERGPQAAIDSGCDDRFEDQRDHTRTDRFFAGVGQLNRRIQHTDSPHRFYSEHAAVVRAGGPGRCRQQHHDE